MSTDYITIPLTKGYFAKVDVEDSDLSEFNWYAHENKVKSTAYAVRHGSRKITPRPRIKMHQVILERIIGRTLEKGEFPDHINGDGTDNRRENLRVATHQQNMQNSKLQINNKSGYVGVFWNTKHQRWEATIKVNRKQIYIGQYRDKNDAIKARRDAEEKYFGEFRRKE